MKKFNRILSALLIAVLALSLTACKNKAPETQDELELSIYNIGEYLKSEVKNPSYEDEIAYISLLRSGSLKYYENNAKKYTEDLNDIIITKTDDINPEDYIDIIFSYTSKGTHAPSFLLDEISYDSSLLKGGYLNKIRALIAFESGSYIPLVDGDITTDGLIEFILSLQMQDGSFQYKGMDETIIEITANSVIALALTQETPEIKTAIEKGVSYLSTRIRKDDNLKDLALTVVALNTAEISATDIQGNDLISWINAYQREDYSFNKENPEDKDGNIEDTAYALMGLTSQYRFNHDMYSFFNMNDILDDVNYNPQTFYAFFFVVPKGMVNVINVSLIVLALGALILVFRFKRIRKLKNEGVYNEKENREMTDEEIVKKDIEEAKKEG